MDKRLWPDRGDLRELGRPWKLATFAVAMALLAAGALHWKVPDWDLGITAIMGTLTYVGAPWSVRVLVTCVRERPRGAWFAALLSLVIAWVVVDGVYVAYHRACGHMMFRRWNLLLSSALYFMAGTFWLYRGTLRELAREVRAVLRRA